MTLCSLYLQTGAVDIGTDDQSVAKTLVVRGTYLSGLLCSFLFYLSCWKTMYAYNHHTLSLRNSFTSLAQRAGVEDQNELGCSSLQVRKNYLILNLGLLQGWTEWPVRSMSHISITWKMVNSDDNNDGGDDGASVFALLVEDAFTCVWLSYFCSLSVDEGSNGNNTANNNNAYINDAIQLGECRLYMWLYLRQV